MLWRDDIDDNVAISQAVELATELSTMDSPAYINGVLGRIVVLKPTISI
jgi:N utilization substance protein B